ncbi:MAG: hypothetical protein AAF581_22040, partial [Planctomycetota bacterium]
MILSRTRSFLRACLAAVALLITSVAMAENFDGIEFHCEPLFPNFAPQGGWWPIRVELENSSTKTRQVEIVIATQDSVEPSSVTWDVELSPGARKREILPAFYQGNRRWAPVVAELREQGATLGQTDLGVAQRSSGGAVLAIAPNTESLGGVTVRRLGLDLLNSVPFASLAREELSSAREAYSGVGALVFLGVGPEELSAAQRDALLSTIRRGAAFRAASRERP